MKFQIHSQLILRTPNLHFQECNRDKLVKLCESLEFREALFLATPGLAKKALNGNTIKQGFEVPLYKYASRMVSRCTPFGLFSGCACVNWGEKTEIVFNGSKRTTRLDFEFVYSIVDYVTRHKDVRDGLKYYPNNTLYISGSNLRYIEYALKENKRWYTLSQVESMPELSTIFNCAENGADILELSSMIAGEEISVEEAKRFVYELIESKLLLSELEPAVTEVDYFARLTETLQEFRTTPEINTLVKALEDIRLRLSKLDGAGNAGFEEYEDILSDIKRLDIPFEENRILQTDLIRCTEKAHLDKDIQKELKDGLSALLHFARKPGNNNLQKFTKAFTKRYETKEIPLLNVMDTETGLGYPDAIPGDITPLIENIELPAEKNGSKKVNGNDKIYLEILQKALLDNSYSTDVKAFLKEHPDVTWKHLPPSFFVMFRVSNYETNEIYIESAGGSSAINIMGRFAHADKGIYEIASDIANEEQENNPNVIFAEIAHNPENRTGNIISHPVFRQFEMPVVTPSNQKVQETIPLQDIMVSVKSERIVLRSKKLNKEIIPRLSCAHNYRKSELPVYKFLCDLQAQGIVNTLSFSWGDLSEDFIFLPRVTHGSVILSLATWHFRKKELREVTGKNGEALLVFLKKWRLPNKVVVAEGDNELLIDFENELSVNVFQGVIKNKEKITLKEFLIDENPSVKDRQGRGYANQFIASFIKKGPAYSGTGFPVKKNKVQREFIPGTEWVYFKYYCGPNTADELLKNMIKPIADKLTAEKIIDKWFFIRYRDDDSHLRVRFHLTDIQYLSYMMNIIADSSNTYVQQDLVWKIQLDTYVREIERYGETTMERCEELFFNDSEIVSELLIAMDETIDTDTRRLWAIKAIDELLDMFNFSSQQKVKLLERLKDNFAHEFKVDKKTRLQLDRKFRDFRGKVEVAMKLGFTDNPRLQQIAGLLNKLTEKRRYVVKDVLRLYKTGAHLVPLNSLASSLIHMHLNRLIPHSQRFHELVIYHLMFKHYRSELAREARRK